MTHTENKYAISILGNTSICYSLNSSIAQFELIRKIQNRYSFRISEVLRLNSECLFDDFKIAFQLSKCNDYAIVRDDEIYQELKIIFNKSYNKSFDVSYLSYYNYLIKYFPKLVIRLAGKNNKVTHSFRYRNSRNLFSQIENKKIIQSLLHHKSVNSQTYYLEKPKPK